MSKYLMKGEQPWRARMSQGFGMSRTISLLKHQELLHQAAMNPETVARALKISKESVARWSAKRISSAYEDVDYCQDASKIESRLSPYEWAKLATTKTPSTPASTGHWSQRARDSNVSIADIYEFSKVQADKIRAKMLLDTQQTIMEIEK